jgi:hypothetical protein
MLCIGIFIKQKLPDRIKFFNERLKQWVPKSNVAKNRLNSGKKLVTYRNRYRKDHVENILYSDDMPILDKTCFFYSFMLLSPKTLSF